MGSAWGEFKRELKFKRNIKKFQAYADPREFPIEWEKVGRNRIALVNLLLSKFVNPRYLEIGCFKNTLFDSVLASDKCGVDPVSGGTHRMTSDEFFQSNNKNYDVVFIDGLHTYEQVRRDLINALHVLSENGFVAFHDFLPRTWTEQHIPNINLGAWTGDVWKLGLNLSETFPNDFRIGNFDHGVGILKKPRDFSPVLVMPDYGRLQFQHYADNRGLLRICGWDEVVQFVD